jgi:hypothetical protein
MRAWAAGILADTPDVSVGRRTPIQTVRRSVRRGVRCVWNCALESEAAFAVRNPPKTLPKFHFPDGKW